MLFEPGWDAFMYQAPRLLAARLSGGTTAGRGRRVMLGSWQRASGPIVDFDDWMALAIPLPPEGGAVLEGIDFEVPLRLVLEWRETRLEFPEGGAATRVDEGGLRFSLDQAVLDGGMVSARLRVERMRKGLLARILPARGLELDRLEFDLLKDGKAAGFVYPRMYSQGLESHEVMLAGHLAPEGPSAPATTKGTWTLVVRRPGKVKDGKLAFSLGALAF